MTNLDEELLNNIICAIAVLDVHRDDSNDYHFLFNSVNKAFEEIVGKCKGDLLNVDVTEIWDQKFIAEWLKRFVDVYENDNKITVENYVSIMDRWLRASITKLNQSQLLISFIDVTEIVIGNKRLRRNDEELRAIYEQAPIVMFLLDSDRRVVKINKLALEMTHKAIEKVIGVRGGEVLGCIHALDDPNGCGYGPACVNCVIRNTILDTLKTGESFYDREAMIPFQYSNGDVDANTAACVLVSTSALDFEDGRYVLVCLKDITEMKKIESDLIEAKNYAEKAGLAKNYFIANICHEIKSPLHVITGYSEVLENCEHSVEIEKITKAISDASYDLSRIMDNILELTSIESGGFNLRNDTIDLKKIINDLIGEKTEVAAKKDVGLVLINKEFGTNLYVGDEFRLKQMIGHIIDNAMKFTFAGKISLKISLENIDHKHDQISVTVEDSGVGIDERIINSVFDPFIQEDNSITKQFRGIGVGLPISMYIAKLMNGDIEIKSKKGVGTIVKISFVLEKYCI